ncbi:DsbA family protein [Flavitalea sp.]|nr:thioredoxin domain-containing protein [Flavitalea sp.]
MPLTPPVTGTDHITGNPQSPIELVEYGDFECPHCGRAYPLVKRIQEELREQVKVIFRNFPLTKVHPHAKLAAVAAEAAAQQGKFWEMHAMLFEHQRNLTRRAITDYAATIGLDAELFAAALENEELSKKVDKQFMSGLRSGVNQTPSFFINGERYLESWEGDNLYRFLVNLFNKDV